MQKTHEFGRRAKVFALCMIAVALLAPHRSRAHEPDAEEVALGSLVDADLAFAKASAEHGVRAAFVASFAPDGIALQPSPTRIVTAWRNATPHGDRNATKLEWKPAQAGVASSHDFGFTTGPYVLRRSRDPAHVQRGIYFSVWQRDQAGRWKVLLDAGVRTEGEVDFAALGAAPRPLEDHGNSARVVALRRIADLRARLLDGEAHGFGVGTMLSPNAYARLLHPDARLYRNETLPVVSRPAIARAIAEEMREVRWQPDDARIARSGDMAATYGRYREIGRDGAVRDGHYAHLWLRDRAGWRLAYDIALPTR
jgi:ketosteroid isomerase-like protein